MIKKYTNILIVILIDCMALVFSGFAALLIRFDLSFSAINGQYLEAWLDLLPFRIAITIAVFLLFGMYSFIWHFVNLGDISKMFLAITVSDGLCLFAAVMLQIMMPRSVIIITIMLDLALLVGIRCSVRLFTLVEDYLSKGKSGERIMIIGAGRAGSALLKEISENKEKFGKVCCIIDRNDAKRGRKLYGAPIIGDKDVIPYAVKKYDITQIIFAIPSATATQKKEILSICKETRIPTKTLPGIYQIYQGDVKVSDIKDVEIEDLLGREPVALDGKNVGEFIRNKVILVTGGGGSIGSELCRQIAVFKPNELVILDCYENNAYDILQELKRKYGDNLKVSVEIASVREKERIYHIFEKYRPFAVFHAAAHKHVPLMESCPHEAVKNNIFGTYHVVRAAERFGVRKFIMISTDKAVNPTNFMGATKRFCEMILQSRGKGDTEFASVRFGNVLGSNGSVIPLFKQQIAEGGPVTITDKRITRFFMTIPEAVQLVLEAGTMAKQNEIFVLDMGDPVKIIELAENLIKLSGKEPYTEIPIEEVGLRPGEKLYEELLMESESLSKTENNKIFIEKQQNIEKDVIMDYLIALDKAVTANIPNENIRSLLKTMVRTYRVSD